ncbi:hypothetical protein C8R46DRAFT_88204 [Mycena filopes]|nr:hypothetical protein C8R46DRAFT_88204 [Mycena filopes]
MAEKRAAIKARRRRWDPPKKVKIAVQIEAEDVVLLAATRADDAVGMLGPSDAPPIPLMEICTENAPMASSGLPTKRTPRRVLEVSPPEPRARKNAARSKTQPVFKSPPEPTRRSPRKLASSSRILPAESPDRHEDVSVAPAPEPASPEESGETVQDQILDDVDGPGGPESATIDQNAAAKNRRKAFMKAYSQRPEVREKQRVRMAEKRAAVKARRRRWDPPKKPKVDVQDAHHSESGGDVVSSIPEEASDDNTVLLDGGESEHLEAFGFGSMGGVYSWDEVIPADEEPRAQKNPAQPFESLAESIRQITRKPASSSGVHSAEPSDRGETNLSMLPAPEPSSPLAQRQESVTRPLIHNQHRTSDEVDGQGSSSTIDRDAAAKSRRKAAMKAYSQ